MADKYWFLNETPPETPNFGGYSYGLIEGTPPEGALLFSNKTQLNKQIGDAEKAWKSATDSEIEAKTSFGQDKKE